MTWRDFFDRDHALYVNERHKMLHADLVAKGVAAHIPDPQASVLDYGCGEALGAPYVSERCGKLYLFDTAPSVRAKLLAANVNRPNISVLDDAGVAAIPDRSLDMIVVVSVLQYVGEAELARLLGTFHDKLKDNGRLVLADIIPKDVSPIDDARAVRLPHAAPAIWPVFLRRSRHARDSRRSRFHLRARGEEHRAQPEADDLCRTEGRGI